MIHDAWYPTHLHSHTCMRAPHNFRRLGNALVLIEMLDSAVQAPPLGHHEPWHLLSSALSHLKPLSAALIGPQPPSAALSALIYPHP